MVTDIEYRTYLGVNNIYIKKLNKGLHERQNWPKKFIVGCSNQSKIVLICYRYILNLVSINCLNIALTKEHENKIQAQK